MTEAPRTGPSVSFGTLFLACALVVLGATLVQTIWGGLGVRRHAAESRPVTARGDLASDERSTIELFERTSPSVVHINTARRGRGFLSLDVEVPEGSGSGFLWDDRGHVVTNFHVIQSADAARVTLSDQRTFEASLIGYDADADLAVLRIPVTGDAPPLPVGTSADLRVGQKVFAIGNPFGLDQTLTTGIISGLGREITSVGGRVIRDVIQTDAAINPGNSGGPLLDSAGRLIGVNTAIVSRSGSSSGVGFAVPVDAVNRIVPSLIELGRRLRPGLGVYLVPDPQARRLLAQQGTVERGALVSRVLEGSAAERAGLRSTSEVAGGYLLGDLIVSVDGEEIESADDLMTVLGEHEVDDEVTLGVLRGGRRIDVAVRLQAVN